MTDIPLKPSNILIYYDGIIKSGDHFILKTIYNNFYDKFKEYIQIPSDVNNDNFIYFLYSRGEENIFKWLSIKEFDYEENYNYFKSKYLNMYLDSKPLAIYNNLKEFAGGYCVKNLVIYSNEYDKRIEFDIRSLFHKTPYENKVIYATGDDYNMIDEYSPDIVFYPNIERILNIARENRQIAFAIPTYGFNITSDGSLKGLTGEDINIGTFPGIKTDKVIFFG